MSYEERSRKKLIVTHTSLIKEGHGAKGPWTLWKLAVTDEQGQPLNHEFKSFRDCPIGQLVGYEVERQDHEKFGTSFLLTPPRGVGGVGGSGGSGGGSGLGRSVDELRARLERIEAHLGFGSDIPPVGPGDFVATAAGAPVPSVAPTPAQPESDFPEDDIPF